MGGDASVTKRALSLGTQDSVTGWYAKSFTPSTIDMILQPRGSVVIGLPVGNYAKYQVTGFTQDSIEDGDEVIFPVGSTNYYEVKSAEEAWWLDSFSHYILDLVRVPMHYDLPTTYGTGPTNQDARQRTKTWLDTYLSALNLTKDDNSTPASYITQWSGQHYPLRKVFVSPKNVDLAFVVDTPNTQALPIGIGYDETVPITIWTIDKTGITGDKLRWKAEAELRRLAENYPIGSLRTLERLTPNEQHLGSTTLYSVQYNLAYKRYA